MSGDQDALPSPGESKPFWNGFKIWNRIRSENNDFNVLMGDTIYSDTEVPGLRAARTSATTVPKKWGKYSINLGQKPWVEASAAPPPITRTGTTTSSSTTSPVRERVPARGRHVQHQRQDALRARRPKAFRDYNPITYSSKNGIYRSFRWGKNLEIFFLDERSFRSQERRLPGQLRQPRERRARPRADRARRATRTLFSRS